MDTIYESYQSAVLTEMENIPGFEYNKKDNTYVFRSTGAFDGYGVWQGNYEIVLNAAAPFTATITEFESNTFKGKSSVRAKIKLKSKVLTTAASDAIKKLNSNSGIRFSNKSLQYKDNLSRYEKAWGKPYGSGKIVR